MAIHENSTANQVPLEIFPLIPGGLQTPGWEPLRKSSKREIIVFGEKLDLMYRVSIKSCTHFKM